jgi:hypothetical protein
VVLSGMQPAWTLTGGGALVGFYTKHRETRDLDLFKRSRVTRPDLVRRKARQSVGISLRRPGHGEARVVDPVPGV